MQKDDSMPQFPNHLVESGQIPPNLYQQPYEDFPLPVWQAGLDAKCNYFNRVWLEFTGCTLEQELTRGWAESIHPDDRVSYLHEYFVAFHARMPFRVEYRLRRLDGEYCWMVCHGTPHYQEGNKPEGQFVGYIGVCYDITELKRMKDALQASESSSSGIIDSAMDAIITIDAQQRIVLFNPAAEQVFGYGSAEVLGQSIDRLIPERFRAGHVGHIQSFAQTGATGRRMGALGTISGLRANGEEFSIEASISQTEVSGQKLFSVILRDITERRKMEASLRESEEQFRTMADSIPQLAWIAHADGSIFWYNRRWHDYTGITPEEMEGQGWQSVHDPALLPQVVERWQDAIASGQPFDMEFPLRGADGHFRTFLTLVQPLKDSQGCVVQWFGTNTDVGELKRVEEALRESEARYRTLFDCAPDGIVIANPEGYYVDANQSISRMLGYTRDELLKLHSSDIVLPAQIQPVNPAFSAVRAGADYQREWQFRRKDGSVFAADVIASQLPDGSPMEMIRDVTERKRIEEELAVVARQMRALTQRLEAVQEEQRGNIARELHDDLGQTLSVLKINLSLLLRETTTSSQAADTVLRQRIESLQQLVDGTLQAVRRICLELRPRVLDDLGLAAAIEWQVDEFKKHTGIRCRLVSEIEGLNFDAQRSTTLFRILQEALTNVARHAGATRVEVRVSKKKGQLMLEVRDNGRGIGPDDMKKTTSLGLLGIRERALLLGGEIIIQGKPGKGTKVRVQIPLSPAKTQGAP